MIEFIFFQMSQIVQLKINFHLVQIKMVREVTLLQFDRSQRWEASQAKVPNANRKANICLAQPLITCNVFSS